MLRSLPPLAALTLPLLACQPEPPAAEAAPAPASRSGLEATGEAGHYRFVVTLQPTQPAVGALFGAVTTVTDAATGAPVDGLDVRLDATMPDHGHGMLTRPEHLPLGQGRYETRGLKLHMPGAWVFEARVAGPRADRVRLPWEQPP